MLTVREKEIITLKAQKNVETMLDEFLTNYMGKRAMQGAEYGDIYSQDRGNVVDDSAEARPEFDVAYQGESFDIPNVGGSGNPTPYGSAESLRA